MEITWRTPSRMSSAWDFPVAIATRRSRSASSSVRYTDVFLIPLPYIIGYHLQEVFSTGDAYGDQPVRRRRFESRVHLPVYVHLFGTGDAGDIRRGLAQLRGQGRVFRGHVHALQ